MQSECASRRNELLFEIDLFVELVYIAWQIGLFQEPCQLE